MTIDAAKIQPIPNDVNENESAEPTLPSASGPILYRRVDEGYIRDAIYICMYVQMNVNVCADWEINTRIVENYGRVAPFPFRSLRRVEKKIGLRRRETVNYLK